MFSRLRIAVVLAGAIALGGCITSGGGPAAPGPIVSTNPKIQAVIDGARTACAFAPTVQTITKLFSSGLNTAFEAINVICAAVNQNPMTEGPRGGRTVPVAVVHGKRIKIEGSYVR